MKARILFSLILIVEICLIPFNAVTYAQDRMQAPALPIAGISVQDLYSQYSMMVYESFVQPQGPEGYPLDLSRYHHFYGFENLVLENPVQMSVYDTDRDLGPDVYPVPEPATLFLFGMGLIFLAGSGRRLQKPRSGLNRDRYPV